MSKSKPSSLSPSLVTKGAAKPVSEFLSPNGTPSVPHNDHAPAEVTSAEQDARSTKPSEKNSAAKAVIPEKPVVAIGPTKSMTVKIDEATYRTLKLHGLETGRSSQDIFLEALAGYFKQHRLQ
jgi:hypothetical protein